MLDQDMDDFTRSVVTAMGPNVDSRVRTVMTAMVHHMHEFMREVALTTPEFMEGLGFLIRAGQMSDDRRNEMLLLADVVGLESLADQITHHLDGSSDTTASAILGPFWRAEAPILSNGASIVQGNTEGATVLMSGRVASRDGTPIAAAVVDVWETAPNGLYEQQDPEQPDFNLRGRFHTDETGFYAVECLRPVSYPIPSDGPAGELLKLMDRHPHRPAHIHLIVTAPGYKALTTQIFDRSDAYLSSDAVFAVKDSLVIDFKAAGPETSTDFVLSYDVVLSPESAKVAA